MNKIYRYIISVLLFLLFFEILLRLTGVLKTNEERAGYGYHFLYRTGHEGWFHTWAPGIAEYANNEFNYTNQINEYGHREVPIDKFLSDTTSVRVLCIGDSFTEGDGAPYDSSWVRRLEFLVNNNCPNNFSFYNAGVCGSDVVYNNKIIEELLVPSMSPQIIIEAVNGSDIPDIIYSGGGERFNIDGTTSAKVGPQWEKWYKRIHVFRALVRTLGGYDENLMRNWGREKNDNEAMDTIVQYVNRTAEFCAKNNIKYISIFHPVPSMVENGGEEEFEVLMNKIIHKPYASDIYKLMLDYFSDRNVLDYSWEENAHFNGRGYYLMGDLIYQLLMQEDEFFCQPN
jgi:hypothetical protein